jgi:hypothetical protein
MAHALQTVARERVEVQIDRDPTKQDWWFVHAITPGPNGERSLLLGFRTSTLETAKALGDRVATVSHQCNDECEDWKAVAA